jgi:hypothetical protein
MSSFGVAKHAHVDAAVFAALLTLLAYVVKWSIGIDFPSYIVGFPAFVIIFLGFYIVTFAIFLIRWSKR